MGPIRGVILDVDGTLVDSNDAHARAWVEALAEEGFHVAFEKVRPMIGMGGDKLLPKVCGLRENSDIGKSIGKKRKKIFTERYLPSLQPTAGAKELLEHMHQSGLRLVVASSAKEEELKGLLRVCGADEFIEKKTSADDAERSKPEPDIVQAALETVGLTQCDVLMLGDTPYDVEAARKAGVSTVAVRCGGWRDADLGGALAVYDDPADLLARYESSPFAPVRE
jgi:HAD superfamily hydrolase (TIGR01549 family)